MEIRLAPVGLMPKQADLRQKKLHHRKLPPFGVLIHTSPFKPTLKPVPGDGGHGDVFKQTTAKDAPRFHPSKPHSLFHRQRMPDFPISRTVVADPNTGLVQETALSTVRHEIGHVLMDYLLGIQVDAVSVRPTVDTIGYVTITPDRSDPDLFEKQLLSYVAGPVFDTSSDLPSYPWLNDYYAALGSLKHFNTSKRSKRLFDDAHMDKVIEYLDASNGARNIKKGENTPREAAFLKLIDELNQWPYIKEAREAVAGVMQTLDSRDGWFGQSILDNMVHDLAEQGELTGKEIGEFFRVELARVEVEQLKAQAKKGVEALKALHQREDLGVNYVTIPDRG